MVGLGDGTKIWSTAIKSLTCVEPEKENSYTLKRLVYGAKNGGR